MSKFFLEKETFRVEFPDGQWCDIKEEMTQADSDFIINKMTKAKYKDVDMDLGKQSLLERMIVDWSFTDGNKIPVNPENISNLRTKYRAMILKEIDRVVTESQEFSKN